MAIWMSVIERTAISEEWESRSQMTKVQERETTSRNYWFQKFPGESTSGLLQVLAVYCKAESAVVEVF